jgi:hypothetical protein
VNRTKQTSHASTRSSNTESPSFGASSEPGLPGYEGLRAEMQGLKAELIKWMFVFWIGALLGGYLLK